jgi:Domain of unknown function (DUF4136)
VKRRLAAALTALVLSAVPVAADDLSIQVDPGVTLSSFKTFALRDGKVNSPRPELDNSLFVKKLGATIREALTARGLKEAVRNADVMVDYVVTGEDFSISAPGLVRGMGPRPVRFAEGTLVIDLVKPGEANPLWRGVYRDDEKTGSRLMQKLPEDARKLIDRYPRQTR